MDAALSQLAARLKGTLIPRATEDAEAAAMWNGCLQGSPAVPNLPKPLCRVEVLNVKDVVECCDFAAQHRLHVSARGAGHHYGGASLTDGIVLDFRRMQAISVDPDSRTASFEPGARTAQLRSATIKHGLHFAGGHNSPVGCAGFTLGGGNGWGMRAFGAGCDSVVELEVVLMLGATAGGRSSSPSPAKAAPEGQPRAAGAAAAAAGAGPHGARRGGARVVRVTAQTEPDLFWGLRGGGLFLGVVTRFTVALHPVPRSLPCITAVYDLDLTAQVASLFHRLLAHSHPLVEPALLLTGAFEPPHAPMAMLAVTGFGDEGAHPAVGHALDEVRSFLPAHRRMCFSACVPYEVALAAGDPGWVWQGLCMYGHGMFVRPEAVKDLALVKAVTSAAASATSPRSLILLCPGPPSHHAPHDRLRATAAVEHTLKGSTCAQLQGEEVSCSGQGAGPQAGAGASGPHPFGYVPALPSAYGFRSTAYIGCYAMWPRTEGGPEADGDEKHRAWVHSVRQALAPWTVGNYINENMLDGPDAVTACYEPPTLARLRELKAACDPRGLLRSLPGADSGQADSALCGELCCPCMAPLDL